MLGCLGSDIGVDLVSPRSGLPVAQVPQIPQSPQRWYVLVIFIFAFHWLIVFSKRILSEEQNG